MRVWSVGSLLLLLLAAPAGWGQGGTWDISPDGRAVTATTKTLKALFRDGTLVSLRGRSGGEDLFVAKPASQAFPALVDAQGTTKAGPETRVTTTREGNGARILLAGLEGDPSARITLDLGVEADGTLTVRQSAERSAPRLLSASWGIAGIDASRAQVVVPSNGGQVIDASRAPGAAPLSWPGTWQAALLAIQGQEGGFSVWAEDPDAQFKSAEVRRSGRELALSFGAETRAPYEEARAATSPAWRVQVYHGDWKAPALAYRERMARAHGLTPIARRQPEWIREIRLVVRVSNDVTVDDLRGLAARVDPRQTLLYVPGWRKHPYDVMYPDYAPREGFAEWCRAAQALGFRVMPHGNLLGIGPKSPDLPPVERFLQTDRVTGKPVGWYLDRPDHPCQIYCLNPAAPEARKLLITRFRKAWEQVRFDALHLDFPVIVSTHGGDLNGISSARGTEVYLRELQAALPEVAFGTEGLNEVLLACSLAQIGEPFWWNPMPGSRMHPVRSAIFAPFCGLYGHLGLPSQASSLPGFLTHHDFFDRLGGWPTLSLDGPLDPTNAGTEFALREARSFQEQRLTPAPEETRWPGELFAWRARDGGLSVLLDGAGRRALAPRGSPGSPAWALLNGANTYDGPGCVVGWRAFEGGHLFGLDPQRRYPLSPGTLDPKVLRLVSASQPVVLREVRDNRRRALFRLADRTRVVADLATLAGEAVTGLLVGGKERPLGAGGGFAAAPRACGGEALPSIAAHPPYLEGALGGTAYGEIPVEVPPEGRTLLRFAIGVADLTRAEDVELDRQKPVSDGATFVVSVNGEERFREHQLRGKWAWHEVDLSPYRGKKVTLRLEVGPGPADDAQWDWASWGQPRVVNVSLEEGKPIRVSLFSPLGAGVVCFGDAEHPGRVVGTRQAAGGGDLVDVEIPVPQPFALVFDPTPVTPGMDLAGVPFIAGTTSGGLLQEGSVFGSGSVGTAEVAGQQWRTLNGHTPNEGRTVLDWCLKLPPEPLRLRFHAQMREGGEAVAFEVQVNGQAVWTRPMPTPDGWKEGTVDLSPWAGRPVLLSLVTDSAGPNICDWAFWGNVRLEAPANAGERSPR